MPRRSFTPAACFALLFMLAFAVPQTARSEGAKQPPRAPVVAQASPPAAPPRAPPTEDGVDDHSCFGGDNAYSCLRIFRTVRKNPHVIVVPQATGSELAAIEARDRRWEARCRPTIRQDAYGMPRYTYAAPGCEYGRLD